LFARPKWLSPDRIGAVTRWPAPAMARLHGRWREAPRPVRWGAAAVTVTALLLIAFLLIFDWNWLRGPVGALASARLHRQVTIAGDLKVHPWSFTPRAEAYDVRIAEPDWAKAASQAEGRHGDMARVAAVKVSAKLLDLIRGRTVLPLLEIDRPDVRLRRQASGRANWTFSDATQKQGLKLPAIQHFIIDDGRLSIDDAQRRITFVGVVSSNERTLGPRRGVFQLTGDGRLNGERFKAEATGAPLLNVSPDRPYLFRAQVDSGPSHILAAGQITRPFNLGVFQTDLTLRGPSLNKLYALTGLALPNTPPYRLHGRLSRDGPHWKITSLGGFVGDSDLSGDLFVEAGGKRPYLKGDLLSRHLEWDDLMTVFGGPPSVRPGQTFSPEQKAQAQKLAAEGRLLPDVTLNASRLRTLDADVRYRALSVTDPHVPVRALDVTLGVEKGVLTATPLTLDLPAGRVAGKIRLDANGPVAATDVDLTLSRGRVQDFVHLTNGARPAIEGGLGGHFRLHGVGDSVRAAAADASGSASLFIPGGQMRQAFAELLGINASKALLQLWSKNTDETPIRCAVATFTVSGGVMRTNRLVFDTGVVVAGGGGAVDLRDERLNLKIEGHSKKPRLVRLIAPITLTGPLRHPDIGVDTSKLVGQGGLGAVLGTLVSPLAAVLPFLTPGGAKDADCVGLLAQAR
jgi:uncharacterized protein involved in outer membrane biogenesis